VPAVVAAAIAGDHEVRIADMNALEGNGQLLKIIGQFRPDIIGISLRNIDNTDSSNPKGFIEAYRKLIRTVRSESRALIVLGGSGLTIFPGELMGALEADYGVIGEGERLALLLDALENRKDTASIPGIITAANRRPLPAPWDKKPNRIFHKDLPHLDYYLKNGGILNLQTKRGCHFKCVYCTYPHIEGRKKRLIPPVEVAETARHLQEAGAKYLFIADAVFNSDFSHNMAIAREFKQAGLSIPWGAFFAPLKPPRGYFKLLAEAGLTHVEFGTESLADAVLQSYRKPYRVDHVFDAHRTATEAGLHVAHYFLLGGPGETTETLEETLNRVENLNRSVLFFFCGMRIYPHTALYDIAVADGQLDKDQSLLEPVFYRCGLETDVILQQVKKRAAGRPNWVIGSGGSKTAAIISKMYKRGHTGPLWEHLI